MELRRVSVKQLNPAPYNPRRDLRPGDPAYEKLARSMNQFGCVEPVVWNERTGNVVGGHQRLKVLIAGGESEIEVSVVNLSPADEKALNMALNKISGEWDEDKLAQLLRELSQDAGIDETLAGFDSAELDHLLADLDPAGTNSAPADTGPYVDSFFESGVQSKPKPRPDPEPAREHLESAEADRWNIVVYALDREMADQVSAFLKDRGLLYRVEKAGGNV